MYQNSAYLRANSNIKHLKAKGYIQVYIINAKENLFLVGKITSTPKLFSISNILTQPSCCMNIQTSNHTWFDKLRYAT